MAKQWYIINVYANFEKKVLEAIHEQVKTNGLEHMIEDVFIPVAKVTEIRKGQKKEVEKKLHQGYVYIKMEMNDETYHLIRSIPKISGFLGDKNKPFPISQAEVDRVIHRIDEPEQVNSNISYFVGDSVRVIDGHFQSFNGIISEVDLERAKLKIEINIFGRATPVELDFFQVEKISLGKN